jgi:hypothetical protein
VKPLGWRCGRTTAGKNAERLVRKVMQKRGYTPFSKSL